MKSSTRVAALVLLLWSFALTGFALADERIEGIVLRTPRASLGLSGVQ
jgi:hypothetical protein